MTAEGITLGADDFSTLADKSQGPDSSKGTSGTLMGFKPSPVPPELDDIVLRALSKERGERYASAKELSEEIQLYLEGEKERARNHQLAEEKVAEGCMLAEAIGRQKEELAELDKKIASTSKEVRPHWPVEEKQELWRLEAQRKSIRRGMSKTFSQAGTTFQTALGFKRGHAGARAGLADLYWRKFLEEEEAGDEEQKVFYENMLLEYNDGQYDERLKGDGKISLATVAYPCPCLVSGGVVNEDQWDVRGYHPVSGRYRKGRAGSEGLPHLEPAKGERFKVHGPQCETQALEGADAWLFRYEECRKILLPVFPKGVSIGDPISVECGVSSVEQENSTLNTLHSTLDTLFDAGSPYRPSDGLYLGKTPIPQFAIPMGSYLIILHKEGRSPVRVSVDVERSSEQDLTITLFKPQEIPPGFVQVPRGRFIYGGDKGIDFPLPKKKLFLDDFFIARFPVTCREYLEFLNSSPDDPATLQSRVPRGAKHSGYYWPLGEDGRFAVPTVAWLSKASQEEKKKAQRLLNASADWEEDWPAFSVTWVDCMHYVAWKSKITGRLLSLPLGMEVEKSARGTDGRYYPWGSDFDETFCNNSQSNKGGMGPAVVDSFPMDESPYGVRGVGGNAADACLNDPGIEFPGWRFVRGGSFNAAGTFLRSAHFSGDLIDATSCGYAFRLCMRPKLPAITK
jgi:formylglycine-generating enzyme required for sulfatase activity